MPVPLDVPETGSPARPSPAPGALAVALQVTADTGYGIWALQGIGLALGIYRSGRGESLVPLLIGLVLVSAGLVVASLRRAGPPDWYGWWPGRNARPTREALTALATYLPMLAVAGLTRGDNDFWATRVAGAAMLLCSLGSLIQDMPRRAASARPAATAVLPLGRLMAALYTGGLWLWLFVAADGRDVPAPAQSGHQPWLLMLLVMALLLGLVEGMRWHALRSSEAGPAPQRDRVVPARFVAALLGYAAPCIALLLADRWQAGGALALLAAISALAGRALEQQLYVRANQAAGAAPA